MKHVPLFQKINSLVSSFSKHDSLVIDGFHPDLLLPLVRILNCRVVLTAPNEYFGVVVKYFSTLWDDDSAVFVSDQNTIKRAPPGFTSQNKLFLRRAKECLSGGVDNIKTIVCSGGGLSVPVVGSGDRRGLVFNDGVVFDVCLDFLISEGYGLVDFVGCPGEYSIRGGIVDVYPFSSTGPYRINFLDVVPTVFRFDVDTQLTTVKMKNFKLSSASSRALSSLYDISLGQFLPIKFNGSDRVCVGSGVSLTHQISLDILTHNQFINQDRSLFNSITFLDGLSSVGVVDEKKNLFIPAWFIKKEGASGVGGEKVSLPLQMSEIKRGDFLVHRDHGVGECLGLVIKGRGSGVQEFLAIKYIDGGVLSIDVGRLDLVGYFAPSGAVGIKLDSLSKRGVWNRKKSSAKRQAEETVQHLLNL